MPKRTRERHLAKLAARRQAERAARRRRRNLILGIFGMAAALLAIAAAAVLLLGGDATPVASGTPSASASSQGTGPCPKTSPPKASSETKPTFKNPPPMTIDPSKTYAATFDTSCGTFTTTLLAKTATDAVNNFVFLAKQGYYDGLVFHRIVKGFVIQGGDPKGDGTGGPGYDIPVTVTKGSSFDAAGVLAYAHSAAGGNGSQFFLTLGPAANLDPPQGKYTIFGNVTKGLNVVKKIGATPTIANAQGEQSNPTYPIFILKVSIAGS
jgi:cyclophilin family peptidyl-prolyl cis-trans isomerase